MPSPSIPFDSELEQVYCAHQGWLRAWIRRRLACTDLACDLAQDVFVRVLVQRRGEVLREPKAYLSSIARNLMVDMFRRQSIEQAYADAMAVRADAMAPSAQERHQIIQTLLQIDHLLDTLGARPRAIFLLVQLDGLSLAEVGRQMKLSTNTVRKHFIRAMAQCLALADE